MVATAVRRFFVDPRYESALPGRLRVELLGFLSMLMAASNQCHELFEDGGAPALVVDLPRSELARRSGKGHATIARYETTLMEAGIVQVLSSPGRSRVLRIIPLDAECADRAANEPRRRRLPETQPAHQRAATCSPVSRFGDLPQYPKEAPKSSRLGRDRAEEVRRQIGQGELQAAKDVAAAIVYLAGHDLAAEAPIGADPKAWRLGRSQTVTVEAAVARRVEALRSSGAGVDAIALANRDLERVVTYAVQKDRPAAYLFRAVQRGDWKSEVVKGSKADEVRGRGQTAEMPQEPPSSRSGLAPTSGPLATPAQRERLQRALGAAGCDRDQRKRAARAQTAAAVQRLTVALERHILEQAS